MLMRVWLLATPPLASRPIVRETSERQAALGPEKLARWQLGRRCKPSGAFRHGQRRRLLRSAGRAKPGAQHMLPRHEVRWALLRERARGQGSVACGTSELRRQGAHIRKARPDALDAAHYG